MNEKVFFTYIFNALLDYMGQQPLKGWNVGWSSFQISTLARWKATLARR